MSLFPAYAVIKDEGNLSSEESQNLSWLTNMSCPPEVGQIPLPPPPASLPQCEVKNDNRQSQAEPQPVLEEKKEKKHKEKLYKKDRKKKKHKKKKDYSPVLDKPSSRSRSKSDSPVRKRKARARSRERKRSRERSLSRERSRSRKRSGSRERSRSRERSISRFRRRKSSSRSRSGSRSRIKSGLKRSRSRERKKSRARRRSKEKREGDYRISGSSTSTDILVRRSKSTFLEDLNGLVKPEDAFYVDPSGDRNNLAFPTVNYTQLSRYSAISKTVLGQAGAKAFGKAGRKRAPRYFRKSAKRVLYSDACLIKTLPQWEDNCKDYVPLKLTYEELNGISGKNVSMGLSTNYSDLFELENDSNENDKGEGVEYAFWQNMMKEYNERLGKEPSNIPLWLEFVRFQDKAYLHLFTKDNGEGEIKKKKVSAKALAERKLSILDSAIKKNPRSLELQFERLEIGQDIWDDKKLKNEWSSILFNFPNKITVWHHYLLFMQTHFTSFSLGSVVGAFAKCTEKLQQIKSGVFITHSPPPEIGKCLVDITVQLAYVWKQGGYMERAISLFQALIEFNLCAHPRIQQKNIALEERLALFEPFWDSRAPRFGEKKASGWAKVMENRQVMSYPEIILGGTQDEEDAIIAQGGTTSDTWLAIESFRERHHWLPWDQDPEDCEDAERMVSFEDISPHLYILDTPEEKFYLLLNFFKFLGVPYAHALLKQRQSKGKRGTKYEVSENVDYFSSLTLENLFDDRLFGRIPKLDFLNDDKDAASFQESGPTLLKSSCTEYCTFVCEALQQASHLMQHPYRTDLTVLFVKVLILKCLTMMKENSIYLPAYSKELKKRIKKILKLEEFRTCLPIYQEYGKFEEMMEHFDEAENVYTASLSFSTSDGKAFDVTHPNFKDIMNLFMSYMKLEFKREAQTCNGHFSSSVFSSLCSLVIDGTFVVSNGVPASGPVILKTKKKLEEMQAVCFGPGTQIGNNGEKECKILLYTKITTFLAIIQLFTVGFKSACKVFETFIEKVKANSIWFIENKVKSIALPGENPTKQVDLSVSSTSLKTHLLASLIEDYLWLGELSYKLDGRIIGERMSPSLYRSLLVSAVEVAPENSTFLLQFALNQNWRDLLLGTEIFSQRKTVLVLVSQILPHLQRTTTLLGNAEEGKLSCGSRLESVLEKGVSCSPGRHCPLLWRIYLALTATTNPSSLKDLIYRAIAACPGVKSVYMDCIRLMPDMLKEIVALLGEKGVRVRLPFEELQVLTEVEVDQDTVY